MFCAVFQFSFIFRFTFFVIAIYMYCLVLYESPDILGISSVSMIGVGLNPYHLDLSRIQVWSMSRRETERGSTVELCDSLSEFSFANIFSLIRCKRIQMHVDKLYPYSHCDGGGTRTTTRCLYRCRSIVMASSHSLSVDVVSARWYFRTRAF